MMFRLRFPIRVALSFCFGLCAFSPLRAELLVRDGQKVAFLGDSITAYGWGLPGGYVRLVVSGLEAMEVKIVPIPAGISGNTSKDMLARLNDSVLAKAPDWMTLSCGVNDVWHGPTGVDLETYKKNIASIIDQAQAKGIKVEILTATVIGEDLTNPNNQKLADYNAFLRQLAKDRNLPLGELNDPFQAAIQTKGGLGNHFTVDGVHMNPYGNRIMAEGVLRGLGASDDQIAKAKAAWEQAPDGAAVLGAANLNGAAAIPFHTYEDFIRTIADRNLNPGQVQTSLLLKAWGTVLSAHAQDDLIDPAALQPEVQKEFARQVVNFIGAAPAPAAVAKAP